MSGRWILIVATGGIILAIWRTGFADSAIAVFPPGRVAEQAIESREESRHFRHVLAVGVAERRKRFPFLRPSKLHIHEDKHWKHRERQQRRPLQQEAEHHQD